MLNVCLFRLFVVSTTHVRVRGETCVWIINPRKSHRELVICQLRCRVLQWKKTRASRSTPQKRDPVHPHPTWRRRSAVRQLGTWHSRTTGSDHAVGSWGDIIRSFWILCERIRGICIWFKFLNILFNFFTNCIAFSEVPWILLFFFHQRLGWNRLIIYWYNYGTAVFSPAGVCCV